MNISTNSSPTERSQLAAAIGGATSPASSSVGGRAASPPSPSSQPGRAELVKGLKLEEIKQQLGIRQGMLGGWLAFEKAGRLVLLHGEEITACEADMEAHKITVSSQQDGVWEVDVSETFDARKISLGVILGELDWLPFTAWPVGLE